MTPDQHASRAESRAILRRRVIVGNVLSYAGMAGALVVFFRDAPIHPVIYAVVGVAVGSGVGLALLSLWKLRVLDQTPD